MPELNKRKEPESISPTLPPPNPLLRSYERYFYITSLDPVIVKKGLLNLGNTCFMNSALQCLVHTVPLTSYFLTRRWESELNTENPLGMGGQIPKAYAELVSSLWHSEPTSHYAPRTFKFTIGERNPTFVGYGQQDSHELLQSLLDGLHEDLNRIIKKEYIEDPEMKGMNEEEFAKLSWDVYKKRNDSIIVDLFQSQLKSRTECQNCGHVSIKFDPYMYLQLPIPEPKTADVFVFTLALDRGQSYQELKPCKIKVTVPRHCSIDDMKLAVAKKLNWSQAAQTDPNQTICLELFSHKIHRFLDQGETIGDMAPNDIICVVETGKADRIFYQFAIQKVPEFHLPAVFTISGGLYGTGFAFGFPIMVTVPEQVTVEPALAENELLDYIGKCCYRQIVKSLKRFALIPLFRRVGSNVTMAEAVQRIADKQSPMVRSGDISWNCDDPEWEPIPDLFSLSIDKANRYMMKRDEVVIYPVDIPTRETTPEVPSSGDVDEMQLPSPKSDLSDLANKFHDRTLEEQAPTQPVYSEFPFQNGFQFVMKWERDIANVVFGKRSIPETSHSSLPNSAIESPEVSQAAEPVPAKTITLAECMSEFTKVELLDGNDTMYCSACKEHQPTKKQLSVFGTPEILVIHLKRFSSSGRHTYRSKLEDFVDAPIDGLDISSLVPGSTPGDQVYDLFGVSNHFGGLGGDTAYVKDPLDGKWYDCDDSRVTRLDSNVMTKAAYLLFYRKRNHKEDNFAQVLKEANKLRDAELEQRKLEREQSLARPSFPTPDAPPSYSSTSWTIPASAEPTVGWQVPSAVATANNSREPSETGMDDESLRGDDFDRIEKQEADWGNDFSKVDEPINEWPVEPLEKEEDTESWQNI